ncbi:DUF1295 domain-containing protein [bacterium]|nr:MAG: DUF1295 domain-containing protein [bacterium]
MALREEIEKQGNWLFKKRSYLPLLLTPVFIYLIRNVGQIEYEFGDKVENFFEVSCVSISFLGLFLRCLVSGYAPEGTSGRNTKDQYAKSLNTTGIYSLMRHPLYLGNFIIFFGIVLFLESWWVSIICTMVFWFYYERIIFSEEEFLRKQFGNQYLEWAKRTHAFLPNFKNWQKPSLRFSFKKVFKKEYSGFFAIIVVTTLLEFLAPIFIKGKAGLSLGWLIFFTTGFIIYLILLLLKTKTSLLNADTSK